METPITCPTCKTVYEQPLETCSKCGFPFTASEKDRAVFIGKQISKKSDITETRHFITRARIILWIIGALIILPPLIMYQNTILHNTYLIVGLLIGLSFIGFGVLSYWAPFISILIPMVLLVSYYGVLAYIDPMSLIKGIVWKIAFLSGLGYALYNIIKAERIKRQSAFLKEQTYK
ncbi:MAG: hypothetical protein R2773_04755 [Flavobacteriaceae bacterium]